MSRTDNQGPRVIAIRLQNRIGYFLLQTLWPATQVNPDAVNTSVNYVEILAQSQQNLTLCAGQITSILEMALLEFSDKWRVAPLVRGSPCANTICIIKECSI